MSLRKVKKQAKKDLAVNGKGWITEPFGLSWRVVNYSNLKELRAAFKEARKYKDIGSYYNEQTDVLRRRPSYYIETHGTSFSK